MRASFVDMPGHSPEYSWVTLARGSADDYRPPIGCGLLLLILFTAGYTLTSCS